MAVHPHPRGESKTLVAYHSVMSGSPPPAWGKRFLACWHPIPRRFTPTRVGKAADYVGDVGKGEVHPHPRGESRQWLPGRVWGRGSPPPAWGKLYNLSPAHEAQRFTPTRVGKARASGRAAIPTPVHPHPRGESHWGVAETRIRGGSPPPAWGKLHVSAFHLIRCRFTPTRVGKAHAQTLWDTPFGVHPHPRGESMGDPAAGLEDQGSPPPAWGKRVADADNPLRDGFTPTRVGKARAGCHAVRQAAVHPHPRGESALAGVPAVVDTGSPPPAWGKQITSNNGSTKLGFTPTRVGKAGSPTPAAVNHTVHPHPRGESGSGWMLCRRQLGSPPPAWGKPDDPVQRAQHAGFTPTRVGKALSMKPDVAWPPVHPHPRGESLLIRLLVGTTAGSPPPAWGKRKRHPPRLAHQGFTPTRVGKAASASVVTAGSAVHPHPRGES